MFDKKYDMNESLKESGQRKIIEHSLAYKQQPSVAKLISILIL